MEIRRSGIVLMRQSALRGECNSRPESLPNPVTLVQRLDRQTVCREFSRVSVSRQLRRQFKCLLYTTKIRNQTRVPRTDAPANTGLPFPRIYVVLCRVTLPRIGSGPSFTEIEEVDCRIVLYCLSRP